MKRNVMIAIAAVVVIIVAAVGAASLLGSERGESIDQSGSTTMAEMAALWAYEFKNETGIQVNIDTPGSGTGIANFINGHADIAQASREIKEKEISDATAAGKNVTEWKVAVDGIAIIVNSNNPVTQLTMEQLKGIYNGSITNWNQVGGNNQAIVLYGRDSASGTSDTFKELVLDGGSYATSMQQFNSNALIIPEVQSNAGGIGYVGIGYAVEAGDQVKVVKLQEEVGSTAYSPLDKEAVYAAASGEAGYPLSRNLYLYTDGVPEEDSAQYKWIEFILGSKGQAIVNDAGFYELSSSDLAEMKAQLGI